MSKKRREPARRKYSCKYRVLSDSILERTDVGTSAKLILMALQYWGRNGKLCFPSNEAIGKKCGISEATVKRTLPELVKRGLLFIAEDDPRTPKGRRFDKLWMDDPALHPHPIAEGDLEGQNDPDLEGHSATRPRGSFCSTPLEGQNDPQGNPLREPIQGTTRTTGSSSSSDASLSEKRQETDQEFMLRMDAEDGIAMAFPGTPLEKTKATIAEYGAAIVAAAARAYKPQDRANEWGYFRGTCRTMKAEGGPPGEPRKLSPGRTASPKQYHTAAPRPATLDKIEAWKLQRKAEDEAAKARGE